MASSKGTPAGRASTSKAVTAKTAANQKAAMQASIPGNKAKINNKAAKDGTLNTTTTHYPRRVKGQGRNDAKF